MGRLTGVPSAIGDMIFYVGREEVVWMEYSVIIAVQPVFLYVVLAGPSD